MLLFATGVSEKCLKETEETIRYFVTFLSLVKFQLGGEARLAKPMLQLRKTKTVFANFP